MIFLENRFLISILLVLSNASCCQSQIVDIYKTISNKCFSCSGGVQNCCESMLILGELPIDVLITEAKLDGQNLFLSGKIITEMDSLSIILGYEYDNKICPIKTLTTFKLEENTFEIEVLISKESIIYFQSLSFQPKVYYVGSLLK